MRIKIQIKFLIAIFRLTPTSNMNYSRRSLESAWKAYEE